LLYLGRMATIASNSALCVRFFLLLIGCVFSPNYGGPLWAQSLTQPSLASFGVATTGTRDSLTVVLTNTTAQTAYWSDYTVAERYGNRVFHPAQGQGSIPANGSTSLKIYFEPEHNITYQQALVLHFDSGFGAINIPLSGQGVYPQTEWSSTQNLSEEALKTALKTVLNNANSLSYNAARDEMYGSLDLQSGLIECVYTGRTAAFNDRPGAVANNFNTEHTVPQSLFGSASPMQSDLHHLFPTDETANTIRNNHPFGPVASPTWTQGGSEYANSVFEPRDVHKGDAARAVFYFVLRYAGNPNLTGSYGPFVSGQESILRQWHTQDPPSAKEMARNNGIETLQGNRSPFVDQPALIERITSIANLSTEVALRAWQTWEDSLLLYPGRAVFVSVVNTGNRPLGLSSVVLSDTVHFELISAPDSIDAFDAAALLVRAKPQTPAGMGAQLLLQANGVGPLTVQLTSGPGGGSSGGAPPTPSASSFAGLEGGKAYFQQSASAGWNGPGQGRLMVLSETATAPQPPSHWAQGVADLTFGSGTWVDWNLGYGFVIANSLPSENLSDTICNLLPGVPYFAHQWNYSVSGDSAVFGPVLTQSCTPLAIPNPGGGDCDCGLFLSEYLEGSGNSKCVEIYNPCDSTVALSGFRIYTNFNGTTNQSVALAGTLAPGGTHVVCNAGSAAGLLSKAQQTNSSAIAFNGNDLVSLVRIAGGDTLDRIGDPNTLGTFWTVSTGSGNVDLVDVTLVRADSVRRGETSWTLNRLQWRAFASNFADSLGSHGVQACSNSNPIALEWTRPQNGDLQGVSVALDAEWALVGSPGTAGQYAEWADTVSQNVPQNQMGAAFVFKRLGADWVQWMELRSPDRAEGDGFGAAVALHAGLFALGAPGEGLDSTGAVYVLNRDAAGEVESVQKCTGSQVHSEFGAALDAEAATLAVGAPGGNGAVQIYEKQGNTWILTHTSIGPGPGSRFGHRVLLSGPRLFVSAPNSGAGTVRVYLKSGSVWTLETTLAPSVSGTQAHFGQSLAFEDPDLYVGHPGTNTIFPYRRTAGTWTALSPIPAPVQTPTLEGFGASLEVVDSLLYVGADLTRGGEGRVVILERYASPVTVRNQIRARDAAPGDRMGYAFAANAENGISGIPLNRRARETAFGVETGGFELGLFNSTGDWVTPWVQSAVVSTAALDVLGQEAVLSNPEGSAPSTLHYGPNPCTHTLFLYSDQPANWQLVDASGRVYGAGFHSALEPTEISVEGLSVGMYFLTFRQADSVEHVRILKR